MAPTTNNSAIETPVTLPEQLYLRCPDMDDNSLVVERSKLYECSSSLKKVMSALGAKAPRILTFHDLTSDQLIFLYDTAKYGVATVLHHERLAYDRLARAISLTGDVNPLPWARLEDPFETKVRVYMKLTRSKLSQLVIRTNEAKMRCEIVSSIPKGMKKKK